MVDTSNRKAVRNGGSLPKKYLTMDNNVGTLTSTGWGACRSLHNSLPFYVPQWYFSLRQYPANEHEPGLNRRTEDMLPHVFPVARAAGDDDWALSILFPKKRIEDAFIPSSNIWSFGRRFSLPPVSMKHKRFCLPIIFRDTMPVKPRLVRSGCKIIAQTLYIGMNVAGL